MEDIDDQKEMEDYYYYPAVNNRGETLDIVRLNSATRLASSTILKLTIGTAIATVYLLVCLGLFAGVIKNRPGFIIPWMIFDVIVSLVINSVLVIVGTNMLYERFAISEWFYCEFWFSPFFNIFEYHRVHLDGMRFIREWFRILKSAECSKKLFLGLSRSTLAEQHKQNLSSPKFISRVVLYRVHCYGPVHLDRGVPVLQYYQTNVEVAWGSDYSMSSTDSDPLPVFSWECLRKPEWIAPPGVRQRSIQLCCLNSLRKQGKYLSENWLNMEHGVMR